MGNTIQPCLILLTAFSALSCATSDVQTKASQAATTPQQAIKSLQDGNARFAEGRGKHRNLVAQAGKSAAGQYPIAAVLGCVDSRASNELIFDQGIGDIFSARVAGNILNDDLLGSLEFATAKAGAKAIVVVGHTRCGAVSGACNHARLGHVTGLLDKIQPAVRKVSRAGKSAADFEDEVAAQNVKLVVSQIRSKSPVLRRLEHDGNLAIIGGMYDLNSRKVEFFD